MVTKADVFKPKVLGGFLQRGRRRPKKRSKLRKPPLTIKQILAWADADFERTGKWPNKNCGQVYDAPDERWPAINGALVWGCRGLPGGSSLPKLLAERRGVRNPKALPRLSPKEILAWADAHFQRTGKWPRQKSGQVYDAPGETWQGIDKSLTQGDRGLPGGSSLAKLLAERRGVPNWHALPRFSIQQILVWADAHHKRTGEWPKRESGRIYDERYETWGAVNAALSQGNRGLPGGSSLVMLLAKRRRIRNKRGLPRLSAKLILAWADAHHKRTGKWPNARSGRIPGAPLSETWMTVSTAMMRGSRGLSGCTSLPKLLAKCRGIRNCFTRPKLTVGQILAWANAHHGRTGKWPKVTSGTVHEAPSVTWTAIHSALIRGQRGLPAGQTLAVLLLKYRGVRCQRHTPKLTVRQILTWADAYHARTGKWPKYESGPVDGSSGDNWRIVANAFAPRASWSSGRHYPPGVPGSLSACASTKEHAAADKPNDRQMGRCPLPTYRTMAAGPVRPHRGDAG